MISKNRIRSAGNHAVIICGRYSVKIDKSRISMLRHFKWRTRLGANGIRYCFTAVQTPVGSRVLQMGRLILGLQFGDPRRSDHRNCNGLDNRRRNLRVASNQQNGFHRRPNRPKTKTGRWPSKYKGVTGTVSTSGRIWWMAKLKYAGFGSYLGIFRTQKSAALAYNARARQVYGRWALLNRIR